MDSEQTQMNIPVASEGTMINKLGQEKSFQSNDDLSIDRIDSDSQLDSAQQDISSGIEGREQQRKQVHGRNRREERNFHDQLRGGLDEQVHLLRNPDYREPGAHEADDVPRHHTKPQESFAPVESFVEEPSQPREQSEQIEKSEESEINSEDKEIVQEKEDVPEEQEQSQEKTGIVSRVKEGAQSAIDSIFNAMHAAKQRVLGISPSEEGEKPQEAEQQSEQEGEGENLSRDVEKLEIKDSERQEVQKDDQEKEQDGSEDKQLEQQEGEQEQFADVARAQATLMEPLVQKNFPVEQPIQQAVAGGKKKKFKGSRKINKALEMNIEDEEFDDDFEQEELNASIGEGQQLYLEKKSEYNVQHSQADNLIGTSGGL